MSRKEAKKGREAPQVGTGAAGLSTRRWLDVKWSQSREGRQAYVGTDHIISGALVQHVRAEI